MPKKKAPAVIEPAFEVIRQRWGTFTSVDPEGNKLVTSMTEDHCVAATHYYLKAKQDGLTEGATKYEGTVGGKL